MSEFVYGYLWKHKQIDIWKQNNNRDTVVWGKRKILSFCFLAGSMQQKNRPNPPTK